MASYILRRLFLEAIPVILIMSIVMFLVMHLAPGGPLDRFYSSPRLAHAMDLKALEHAWGLDKPLYVQYGLWLWGMITGHWGFSFVTGQQATTMIRDALFPTLSLLGSSLVLTVVLGVPLGVYQATHPYTLSDYLLTLLSFLFFSFPSFFLGLAMLLAFSVFLPIFPSGGMLTPGEPFSLADFLMHLIPPMLTLSLISIAGYSRFMRTSLLDTLGADYIRTARAKGLSERVVVWRHAVRNALIPLINILALSIAGIFSGAVVTEFVFSWPGMGTLFIDAAFAQDYSVMMAVLFLSGVLVVLFNIVADVAMALVDPRITYS